jgi:F-type H+-transporting ATPase subunit delta
MTSVARPYVAAAFEYALAKNDLSAWESMLNSAAAITQNAAAAALLVNPKITKTQLAEFFCGILSASLNTERTNFIRLLAEKNRLSILPDIAELFKAARALQEKTMTVQVTSAVPLDNAYQQKLIQALTKRLQRQVELQTHVDPALLGGVMVRMNDTVIDGSIRGKLNRLIEFI